MDLYEVSKSGKSVHKFTLKANEKMVEYKKNRTGDISLYQFETGDYSLMSKLRETSSIPFNELSNKKEVDPHSRLGKFNAEEVRDYNEVKRLSPMYYYSLSERVSLENAWLDYLEGNYQSSNLLSVYLGDKETRMNYCNHFLLPEKYEMMRPFMPDDGMLTDRLEKACPIYSMKNIFDLPEELFLIELLEQGRYQTITELSLPVDPELMSCYEWVDQDLYRIGILEEESMSEIASTLDMQKSMLKSIRKTTPWRLKK